MKKKYFPRNVKTIITYEGKKLSSKVSDKAKDKTKFEQQLFVEKCQFLSQNNQ